MPDFLVNWTSERSIWVEFPDAQYGTRVSCGAADLLRRRLGEQARSVVPAGPGVLVELEPELVVENEVESLINQTARDALAGEDLEWSPRDHLIPVCYDNRVSPDLRAVAEACAMSIQELIDLHTKELYIVESIGFSPGFGYLGSIDERLQLPRRKTPRTQVPAGSVAIAERFTAVYPFQTPGGWHLIGRSPTALFLPSDDSPCSLLRVGDRVRFHAIPYDEFNSRKSAE